ncbi:MAG: GGDEF domain-containing protein [Actinobacteria bacterium]|nr:GGDEF domain-containing protein [Actinomycetota bacterium]
MNSAGSRGESGADSGQALPRARADDAGGGTDPKLLPYRNWALQNSVITALEINHGWSEPNSHLGLEDAEDENPGSSADQSGRGPLIKMLEPDLEIRMRTNTALALWASALIVNSINQWGPIGIKMAHDAAITTTVWMAVSIVITAITYPLLRPKAFKMVDQFMVAEAYVLIAYMCHATGGAESPYAVWWLFAIFYAVQFFERRRAYVNAVVTTALVLAPVVYDPTTLKGDTPVVFALLLAVIWTLTLTLVADRRSIRSANQAVRYLALADPLTGVANLRSFELILETALREQRPPLTLLVADVDGLKGANAAFGYDVGDDMLRRFAALLMRASDDETQVARVRGDEFVVLLPGDETATQEWRDRFERDLSAHNGWVKGRLPRLSAEFGAATFPLDGSTPAELIEAADRELLVRKRVEVKPPFEVDVSARAGAERMLRPVERDGAVSRSSEMRRRAGLAAIRWLVMSAVYFAWLMIPGMDASSEQGLPALALVSLAVAGFAEAGRVAGFPRLALRVSDVATMLIVLPTIWITGGWQSPVQFAIFLPVAFYAQIQRGVKAIWRVATVVGAYALGFWTSGPLGLADPVVSPTGQTLFATVVTATVVITLILQSNRSALDNAIRQIRDAATHDATTGAPNIHAFRRDLTEAVIRAVGTDGRGSQPALVLVDVNDFKDVNVSAGHLGGDAVLRETAQRLGVLTSRLGTIYRIGCDEFAVLMNADRADASRALAGRIDETIRYYPKSGIRLRKPITVSVGHAVWRPGMTAEELVDTAEGMLVKNKPSRGDLATRHGATLL